MRKAFFLSLSLLGCDADDAARPDIAVFRGSALDSALDCTKPKVCELVGGTDALVVRTTYTGLDFETNAEPPAPTLSVYIDGVAVSSPPGMIGTTDNEGALTFVSGPFFVPAKAAASLTIVVEGGSGYTRRVEGFSVVLPPPTQPLLVVSGCPKVETDGSCRSFQAAVGAAHLRIDAQAEDGARVIVRSFVDGVPYGEVASSFKAVDAGASVALLDVRTPDVFVATSGRRWSLEVTADGKALSPVELTLVAPTFAASFEECTANPCELPAERVVNLGIRTPADFHGADVHVRTFLNAIPFGSTIEPALDFVEGDERVGNVALRVPDAVGQAFEARVYFGFGYVMKKSVEVLPPDAN